MSATACLRTLSILFIVVLLSSCNNWGEKISKDYLEVYYKDGITDEEATRMLNLLYPVWKSQDSANYVKKSVQLTRKADTVNFRMVVNPEKIDGVSDGTIQQMANEFSVGLFGGKPVNVDLTDPQFKTLRTLHFVKQELPGQGQ